MWLDIPAGMFGNVCKKQLRSKDVTVDGVDWQMASFYCTNLKTKCNKKLKGLK
jgi:hypothetical protein